MWAKNFSVHISDMDKKSRPQILNRANQGDLNEA